LNAVAAVILAAGAGRRLGGVSKALLRREDGQTFLEAILACCREASVPAVVVLGLPHASGVGLGIDARVVWNAAPERGMASSLAVGLAALDPAVVSGALVWPVDHAWVRADTVATIGRAGARGRAVVPTYEGRGGHPTFFGADLWPELHAAADGDGDGARGVLRRDPTRVLRLAVDDPGVLRDVDLPADLDLVRS
jgi:molybdenum cofactor cytidylyltransferase